MCIYNFTFYNSDVFPLILFLFSILFSIFLFFYFPFIQFFEWYQNHNHNSKYFMNLCCICRWRIRGAEQSSLQYGVVHWRRGDKCTFRGFDTTWTCYKNSPNCMSASLPLLLPQLRLRLPKRKKCFKYKHENICCDEWERSDPVSLSLVEA